MVEFHLLRPYWLLAIIPLILLFLYQNYQQKQASWHKILSLELAKLLIPTSNLAKHKRLSYYFLPTAWLLAVIALSGPSWQQQQVSLYKAEVARVLILDMSLSMLATDIAPNRATIARYKALDMIGSWQEGESGLLAYTNEPFVISPLTEDSNTLANLINYLSPAIMPSYGSNASSAIARAIALMQDADYKQGQIILFTDGINAAELAKIIPLLRSKQWSLTILGFGTIDGAPIRLPDGQLMKNKQTGGIVLPSLDSNQLKMFCKKQDCLYLQSTIDGSDIQNINERILNDAPDAAKSDQNTSSITLWKDNGFYLLFPLLIMCAFAFRKGILLIYLLTPLLLTISYSGYTAEPSYWWNNKSQRAHKAFEHQQYELAADLFTNSNWIGSALYNAGQYEQAAKEFGKLGTAEGYYNQGNALAKLNQLDQAITAYKQALGLQADHQDALFNKKLLESIKKQQEQDKKQEQEENKQQNQDKKQQDKQQQEQDNKQQQKGDKKQKEGSKQQEQEQDKKQEQEENKQQQKQRRLEQLLQQLPDDPSLLLKNKMQLEHQRRGSNQQMQEQKW